MEGWNEKIVDLCSMKNFYKVPATKAQSLDVLKQPTSFQHAHEVSAQE
jgi:hypothetical protein